MGRPRIDWTKEELDYAIQNFGLKSYREIGLDIGRTRIAVMVKMHKMGYKLEDKYNFDKRFFENIDNEEKAYWLGFIYADGYIYISKQANSSYCLGIELKYSDKNHLKKFNKSINGNIKITDRDRKIKGYDNISRMSAIRIYSKQTIEDLLNLGISYRKSKKIIFPKLNTNLVRHFIRGYFDGDGSINIDKRSKQLRCAFCCGSKIFLEEMKNILDILEIKSYIGKTSPNSNCFSMGIVGKKSNKDFLEYIYNDSNIILDRKYDYYIANKELLRYINKGWPQ